MDGTRAIRVAPAAFLCATADLWGGCTSVSILGSWSLPAAVDFGLLAASCAALFALCLWLIRRRWIA
jgi:hypothetical protein